MDATGRYSQTLDAGPFKSRLLVNGRSVWNQGGDGRVAKDATGELHYHIASLLCPWLLAGQWREEAPERRYGRAWAVATANFPGAVTISLFLAPESGALCGVRVIEPEGSHFSRFEDWRVVDGVRWPFIEWTEAVDLEKEGHEALEVFTYVSVEVGGPVPADLFEPPKPRARIGFDKGAERTGAIAFGPGQDLVFPVEIAGRQVLALFDSGASVTHLHGAFASEIGVRGVGAFRVPGTSGTEIVAQVAEAPPVRISNMTVSGLTVGLTDLSAVRNSVGRAIEVVLGQDLLEHTVAAIDFEAGDIEFIAPSRYRAPQAARSFSLRRVGSVPTIKLQLEAFGSFDFTIDLGNTAAALVLYGSFWKSRRMLDNRPWRAERSVDVSGIRSSRRATIETARLGDWTFRDLPSLFVDIDKGKAMESLAGNIGLPLLSRFHLVLDYPADRLFLTPHGSLSENFAVANEIKVSEQPID